MAFVGRQDDIRSISAVHSWRRFAASWSARPGEPGEGRRSTRVRSIGWDTVASPHRFLVYLITYRSDLLTRGIYYISA